MSENLTRGIPPGHAHVVSPKGGPATWVLNTLHRTLVTSKETNGQLGVFEQLLDRNGAPPLHIHHREDEAFYVLEGDLTVTVGEERLPAPTGAFVFLPRQIPHAFTVNSDRARFLTIITPGGFEDFFLQAGQPAQYLQLPEPMPPDLDKLVSIAASFDCEVLPPPA
jgi:quercetin dioxygenase-like cupin family protein